MKQTKQKTKLPVVDCGACNRKIEVAAPGTFRRVHYRLRTYKTYKGQICTCGYIVKLKENYATA